MAKLKKGEYNILIKVRRIKGFTHVDVETEPDGGVPVITLFGVMEIAKHDVLSSHISTETEHGNKK